MTRVKNIARKSILLATMLLIGYCYAHAQNTGAAPYLDSYHAYQVRIGKVDNVKEWVVTNKDAVSYTITNANQASFSWFSITPAGTNGGNERVNIYFDRTVFSIGGWYLQYYEYENHGGSLICISAREFEISVSENTFYLVVGDDKAQCNDITGLIRTYAQVDNDPPGSDLSPTEVTYTVTMNKTADYNPNSFSFEADFDQTPTNFAVSVTTDGGGAASFTENSGTYSVTVTRPGGGADPFPNEVEVTLAVTFSIPVLTVTTPTLTVSNGQAVVSGTPPAITYDNETIYPVATPGDRTQAITINALPATRDIAHNAAEGETAASAQNPMQNSTHNYTVQMGNIADWNRGTTGWHIVETVGGTIITPGATTYTLTRSQTATHDNASIRFNTLAEGDYILYFTEENSEGCTTMRAYPFTILPPFDVDIAAANNTCATVSGQVNNTPLVATTTTVNYVVNLITAGYEFNWQFDFTIAGNPALGTELNVTGITANVGNVTVLGDYSRRIVVEKGAEPVARQVTISVTYSGLYANQHTLTATLSNITGSFIEEDADEDNETQHILYRMPQAGVLAGVD